MSSSSNDLHNSSFHSNDKEVVEAAKDSILWVASDEDLVVPKKKTKRTRYLPVDPESVESVENALIRAMDIAETQLAKIESLATEQLLRENPLKLSLKILLHSLKWRLQRLKQIDEHLESGGIFKPIDDDIESGYYRDTWPASPLGGYDTQVLTDSDIENVCVCISSDSE